MKPEDFPEVTVKGLDKLPPNVGDTVKNLLRGAKFNVENHPELSPVFFIFLPNGQGYILPADFSSDDAKDAMAAKISKIAKDEKAEAVMLLSEAWVAKVKKGDDLTVRASLRPDREEVVAVNFESVYGSFSGAAPIIHEDGKRTIGTFEFQEFTDMKGRFVGLLPKPDKSVLH